MCRLFTCKPILRKIFWFKKDVKTCGVCAVALNRIFTFKKFVATMKRCYREF